MVHMVTLSPASPVTPGRAIMAPLAGGFSAAPKQPQPQQLQQQYLDADQSRASTVSLSAVDTSSGTLSIEASSLEVSAGSLQQGQASSMQLQLAASNRHSTGHAKAAVMPAAVLATVQSQVFTASSVSVPSSDAFTMQGSDIEIVYSAEDVWKPTLPAGAAATPTTAAAAQPASQLANAKVDASAPSVQQQTAALNVVSKPAARGSGWAPPPPAAATRQQQWQQPHQLQQLAGTFSAAKQEPGVKHQPPMPTYSSYSDDQFEDADDLDDHDEATHPAPASLTLAVAVSQAAASAATTSISSRSHSSTAQPLHPILPAGAPPCSNDSPKHSAATAAEANNATSDVWQQLEQLHNTLPLVHARSSSSSLDSYMESGNRSEAVLGEEQSAQPQCTHSSSSSSRLISSGSYEAVSTSCQRAADAPTMVPLQFMESFTMQSHGNQQQLLPQQHQAAHVRSSRLPTSTLPAAGKAAAATATAAVDVVAGLNAGAAAEAAAAAAADTDELLASLRMVRQGSGFTRSAVLPTATAGGDRATAMNEATPALTSAAAAEAAADTDALLTRLRVVRQGSYDEGPVITTDRGISSRAATQAAAAPKAANSIGMARAGRPAHLAHSTTPAVPGPAVASLQHKTLCSASGSGSGEVKAGRLRLQDDSMRGQRADSYTSTPAAAAAKQSSAQQLDTQPYGSPSSPCSRTTTAAAVGCRSVAVQVGSMNDKGVQVVFDQKHQQLWDGGLDAWPKLLTQPLAQASLQHAAAQEAAIRDAAAASLGCQAFEARKCQVTGGLNLGSIAGSGRSTATLNTASAVAAQRKSGLGCWNMMTASMQQLRATFLLDQLEQLIQTARHPQQQQQLSQQQQQQRPHVGIEEQHTPLQTQQHQQQHHLQQPTPLQHLQPNARHAAHTLAVPCAADLGDVCADAARLHPAASNPCKQQQHDQWFSLPLSQGESPADSATGTLGQVRAVAVRAASSAAAAVQCAAECQASATLPTASGGSTGVGQPGSGDSWMVLPGPSMILRGSEPPTSSAPPDTGSVARDQQLADAVAADVVPAPGQANAGGWFSIDLTGQGQAPASTTADAVVLAASSGTGAAAATQGNPADRSQVQPPLLHTLAPPPAAAAAAAATAGEANSASSAGGWFNIPVTLHERQQPLEQLLGGSGVRADCLQAADPDGSLPAASRACCREDLQGVPSCSPLGPAWVSVQQTNCDPAAAPVQTAPLEAVAQSGTSPGPIAAVIACGATSADDSSAVTGKFTHDAKTPQHVMSGVEFGCCIHDIGTQDTATSAPDAAQRVSAVSARMQQQQLDRPNAGSAYAAQRPSATDTLRRYAAFLGAQSSNPGAAPSCLTAAAELQQQVLAVATNAEHRSQLQQMQTLQRQLQDAFSFELSQGGGGHILHADTCTSHEDLVESTFSNNYLNSSIHRIKSRIGALNMGLQEYHLAPSAAVGRGAAHQVAGMRTQNRYTTLEQVLAEIRQHRKRQV